MSGWACVFRRDGAPVSADDVEPMMPRLRAHAPHGEARAVVGARSCMLVHTVLDTKDRVPLAREPVRVGPLTAVGQVRIDARDDVARALGLGFADRVRMTDLELMAHAFLHWGDGVLARVGGEYSGGLFDERTREAVLFRDGFGVRQCFFSVLGPWLVASSSLGAVRRHAAVSDALDDDAILDFLLFDWIMDKEKTAFSDIARLHPGHVLRVDAARVRNAKSWQLELPEVDHKSSVDEIGERWRAALDLAVKERLGERTSFFLSGGIDSTAIAVSAAAMTKDRGSLLALTLVSTGYDDDEGTLAAATARMLGISHVKLPADRLVSSEVLATDPLDSPEPTCVPFAWEKDTLYPTAQAHAPIALDGEGGDEIWRAYTVRELLGRVPAGTLARDVARTLMRGRRPAFGTGLVRRLTRVGTWSAPPPPPWIAPRFQARAARRSADVWRALDATHSADERGRAFEALRIPTWAAASFARHPEVTGAAVEVRFPLLDRRVVDAALRAPNASAADDKRAARAALSGRVPRSVLERPKAGVGDPLSSRANPLAAWRQVSGAPGVGYYLDVERFVAELPSAESGAWSHYRALALARWLLGEAQRAA